MDKLQQGLEFYLAGDPYSAIRVLKEYISEGGAEAAVAYYHIGVAYSDMQKLADACENLKKAVELDSEKSMYHYRLGVVYSRLMMLDLAAIELKRSLELNSEHQRSRYILGTVYFKLGDMKKACDTFTNVISSSPDFASAYYHRGLARFHSGDEDGCIADMKKTLELSPEYNEAYLRLAYLYLTRSDFARTVEMCEKIYDKGAKDRAFFQLFLNALSRCSMHDRVAEVAAEALVLYPNDPEIRHYAKEENS